MKALVLMKYSKLYITMNLKFIFNLVSAPLSTCYLDKNIQKSVPTYFIYCGMLRINFMIKHKKIYGRKYKSLIEEYCT